MFKNGASAAVKIYIFWILTFFNKIGTKRTSNTHIFFLRPFV